MNKYYGCLIMLSLLLVLFVSCAKANDTKGNEEFFKEDEEFFEEYFSEYVMGEDKSLEECLTKEYILNDLMAFFEGRTSTSTSKQGLSVLKYSEVNEKYPIEVFRPQGYYSVYKVVQGGYFYVFWVSSFVMGSDNMFSSEPDKWAEPAVYFSTYLSSDKSASIFDTLKSGNNTLGDVKKIDPFLELCTLRSSGIVSYSYINKETVAFFKYEKKSGEMQHYDDMIMKEIAVMSREKSGSKYGVILSEDLP